MEYKIKCEKLDYRGYGIVKDLGKVGFIKGLLPTEEAIIKVTLNKKNYFEGEIVNLLVRSKDRSNYEILYDNNSLIHLESLKQLDFQQEITLETFIRNGIMNFKKGKIIHNESFFNYRNKALFFVENDPYLKLGGYKERTKIFREIDNLKLVEPAINQVLKELNTYYEANNISYDDLSSIVIRSNHLEEVMVIFVTNSKKKILEKLYKPLLNNERIVSIYQNYKDSEKRNVGTKNILIAKENYLIDKIGNLKFIIYPNSFFQVNRDITYLTYEKIKALLDSNDIVIDAFAGISSIGQFISKKVKQVYSIEIDDDSVLSAKESIKLNNIKNLNIIKGDFNIEFDKYKDIGNTLIIDPPRQGISDKVIDLINDSNMNKIIYLSCNLKTLVRDLKLLTNYEIISVTPIKMFFQTVEMETLVYLKKR